MPISSVTAFGPITSAMFQPNAGSSASAGTSGATSQGNNAVQDFLDYAKMSPTERMREEILKSLGMTEQQFEKLSPAQQQAMNQKIQQIMLQQLQQNSGKTGQLVNVSA
ncbi:MAG: hypothetical protein WAU79_03545 [Bradyrhizobium sp.]|uniref:hypothetical protein n=1 Tax=Bradyrhizobium sp. TaxID=376 RepID=UPI003BB04CA7